MKNLLNAGKRVLLEHSLTLAMLIGAVVAVAVSSFASFAKECERLPEVVLRLHIIAESDSVQDQQLKYEVRDFVLENFAPLLQECDSLESATEKSRELLSEIESASREHFSRDDICAQITQMYFPTRRYDSGTLPAGNYTALRITIGEARGENWWCVMFPVLCIPAVTYDDSTPAINLPESVTDSPKIKFAVFEFFSNLVKR
jgi:stage II sporulation protein R